MEVFVLVKNCGLINEDVSVFRNRKDALKAFKEYTGFRYRSDEAHRKSGNKSYSEDFEQTIIQKVKVKKT